MGSSFIFRPLQFSKLKNSNCYFQGGGFCTVSGFPHNQSSSAAGSRRLLLSCARCSWWTRSILACTSGCLRLIRTESSPTSRPERNQSNRISSAGQLGQDIGQCSQRFFNRVGHAASSRPSGYPPPKITHVPPSAKSRRGLPTERGGRLPADRAIAEAVTHSAKDQQALASTGAAGIGCTARGRLPRLAHRHCVAWPPRTNVWADRNKTRTGGEQSAHPAELLPQIRIVGRVRQLCPTSELDRLGQIRTKGKAMWIKSSLIALRFAGAMVASTPAPVPAQGVHIGSGGVQLTLVDPATVSIIVAVAITPMTGARELRTVTIERAGRARTIQTLRLAGGRVCCNAMSGPGRGY